MRIRVCRLRDFVERTVRCEAVSGRQRRQRIEQRALVAHCRALRTQAIERSGQARIGWPAQIAQLANRRITDLDSWQVDGVHERAVERPSREKSKTSG